MTDIIFDDLTEIEFAGKNFVFTGLSEQQERTATEYVLRLQGMIRTSTVLQTDYLIVDANKGIGSTKYARALELRQRGCAVKILCWDTFLVLASAAAQHTSLLDFIISDGVLEHYYGNQTCVVVPEGVVSIADGVFAGKADYFSGAVEDHYLESIELPQTLESIGEWAFHNCNKLEKITIPANVKSIGKWAFCGCRNLKEITILGEKTVIRQESFDAHVFEELLKTLLPGQITTSEKGKALEMFVEKYDSEEEMPEKYKTTWIKYIKSQRKKLLDQACQSIPLLRLLLAEKLLDQADKAMVLEKSTQSGSAAVTGALLESENQQGEKKKPVDKLEKGLKSVTQDTALKKLWTTKKQDDGTILLTIYKGDETTVTIPGEIGAQVTLDAELFSCHKKGCKSARGEYYKTGIQKVIISEGVAAISVGCFAACEGLIEVDMPDSLRMIQRRAFDGCKHLASLRIPAGVETIAAGSFSWCDNLSDVYVLGKNTQIDQYAFTNTPNLTIHAPKGSLALKFAKKYKIPFVVE